MVKLMSKGQQYPRISVVIPALNEAQNLQYVLSSIPPIMIEAVLVDGHATNDAIDLARRPLTTIHIVKQV